MDGPKPIDEFTVEPTPAATDYIITKRVGVKAKRSLISSVASTIAAIIGGVYELLANKDTDSTFAANSNTKYPSQKAVVDGIQGGKLIYAPSTSAANTYTANLSPAITAYTAGMVYFVKFTNANTGAATMNFNGVGAIAMKKNGATALASGDIPAGAMVALLYDGTNFQVLGIAVSGGGSITIGTTAIISGVIGRVMIEGAGNVVSEDANLFWDAANVRLGVGQPSPTAALHIYKSTGTYVSKFESGNTVNYNQFISTGGIGEFGIDGDAFYFQALDSLANGIVFYPNTAGVNLFKILSTGKVGVNCTPATYLSMKASASSKALSVGGKDKEFYLDSGNVIATGETDLYSRTFEASLFGANGDTAYFSFTTIIIGAATPAAQLRIYFGGTNVYDSTAKVFAVGDVVKLKGEIIRVSSTVVRVTTEAQLNTGVGITKVAYTEVTALTLTNTQVFKLTGESAGAGSNDNDIVAKMGFIRFEEVSQ